MLSTVRFAEGVEAISEGYASAVLVEVGPGRGLCALARRQWQACRVSEESAEGSGAVRKEVEVEAAGASIVAVASLREGGEDEASGWWRAGGEVWVNGV